MRTNKTASHIYYELDHDVQEYAKRLLAKKILHAAQQNNAAPLSDKTAKKTAETAVFLTERLALLYELNSGFRGIRFSTFGEQPAVYTTMVQHNAPLYDELMLGRAYNLASFLAAESPDIREVVLMKHGVLAAIYNAAAHMKERTPEPGKISVQSQLFVSTAVELNEDLKQRLLETGTQPIEEDTTSWHDNYWGNCHCPKCRNIPGQNRLGIILMETRDKLKKQTSK